MKLLKLKISKGLEKLKIFQNKRVVFVLVFICLIAVVNAGTYNYHFSNSGNDNTGDGTQSKPWASLTQAKSAINDLASTDIAHLYFKRGDTWTWDSAEVKKQQYRFSVSASNPIVHIDAYGTGNKPVFDGLVDDFDNVPDHSTADGPYRWNRFFDFQRDHCSIQNIEIKKIYGRGIMIRGANFFSLKNSYIHDFGSGSIGPDGNADFHDVEIAYNVIHTGQEIYRAGKDSGGLWGGGLSTMTAWGDVAYYNIHVHHNIVYDIYGEGIISAGSAGYPNGAVIENNIVGDCGSVAIDTTAFAFDYGNTIVRNNLIVHSDHATSIYDNHKGGVKGCLRVFDESTGGDNSQGTVEMYDNICINRKIGFWIPCSQGDGSAGANECNPLATAEIHNNLVIDPHAYGIWMSSAFSDKHVANVMEFHNNSFILFDQKSRVNQLINDQGSFPATGWTATHNHFWIGGVTPTFANADNEWKNDWVITDPKLPGEPSFDWDGMNGPDYFKQISFKDHLYPLAGSALNDIGITKEYLQNICNGLPIDLDCGDACTENWNCTAWSAWSTCSGGTQSRTRTCTDLNSCGTTNDKPPESETRSCGTGTLIAHYTMDAADISGDQVMDISGNGNHATIIGNPQQATGKLAESLDFDGVDDYLDTGYTDDLDEWTVAVWVRGDADPSNTWDAGPVMKQENFLISWDHAANPFREAAGLSVGGSWYPASFGTLVGGTWYHIAATYDGETLSAYRDGNLITENTVPSGPPDSAAQSMKIARHAVDDFFFEGMVDEVRIYNGALSAEEIAVLFEAVPCHRADTDPPYGCIDFDELFAFIDLWKENQATIGELMGAIGIWKGGC